jgi:hypothetical protein
MIYNTISKFFEKKITHIIARLPQYLISPNNTKIRSGIYAMPMIYAQEGDLAALEMTKELWKLISPLKKRLEYCVVLPPNRFIMFPELRRGEHPDPAAQSTVDELDRYYVTGVLKTKVEKPGKLAIRDIELWSLASSTGGLASDLKTLPADISADILNPIQGETVLEFTLSASDTDRLKKIGKLQISKAKGPNKVHPMADHMTLTYCNDAVAWGCAHNRGVWIWGYNSSATGNHGVGRRFRTDAITFLRPEDYDVSIDACGLVQMKGRKSGLTFHIPSALCSD